MEYNLCDYSTITKILSKHGFTFSKALGQNFLINPDVCPAMAYELDADENTGVIEIGPGIGVLTKELCRQAGKVVAIELDKRLYPVLDETLNEYANFELVCADVMKTDMAELIEEKFRDFNSVKVCANLPYYITSPIVMMLLENNLPIDEIEVMVQKEAAQRICAPIGSRDAGALSVAVKYYGESEILFDIGKESFMPSPKVDSAVIKIKLHKNKKYEVKDEKFFFSFVKAAFAQRRKTLVNSISNSMGVSKEKITTALSKIGLDERIRAEKLTMEDLINLSDLLSENK